MSGRLIVIEGIDGSGKSTQFKMLCDRLSAADTDFRRIVFPRYDKPSSALIRMYLSGEFGTDPGSVNAYAASAFFAVDRYASYVQDWQDYYQRGGLILTDRYTTSNALHQGAKLPPDEREQFFKWLFDFEQNLFGLPKPERVIFLNIDVNTAAERLSSRFEETSASADIHEQDLSYLKNCAQSGMLAASLYGWNVIDCAVDEVSRSAENINNEIYEIIR